MRSLKSLPPLAGQNESGGEEREKMALLFLQQATKGEEKIWAGEKYRKYGWTVLTREQVGINWVISKKLTRHEH